MKFKSRTNLPKAKETPTGSKMEARYAVKTENGITDLYKTGETDIYTAIQQYAEETKIDNILAASMYDPAVLNQVKPMYIDCTEVPNNLADMQTMVLNAKYEFEQLPIEVRQKFNNSPEQYIQEYGTDGFFIKCGLVTEAPTAPTETGGESIE